MLEIPSIVRPLKEESNDTKPKHGPGGNSTYSAKPQVRGEDSCRWRPSVQANGGAWHGPSGHGSVQTSRRCNAN